MLVSYFQPAGKLWPLPDLPLDRRTGTLFPSHQGRMAFDLASDVQAKNRHFWDTVRIFQGAVRRATKRSAICRSIFSNDRLAWSYAHIRPDATSNHHPCNRRVPADTLSRTIA